MGIILHILQFKQLKTDNYLLIYLQTAETI